MKNVCILLFVFQVLSFNDAYNFSCPSNAQWAIRAKSTCTPPKDYTCLYNVTFQVNVYTDRCSEPRIISPGYKYVFQPNPNDATCTKTRYQPFIFDTIGYSDCAILKSLCNSKGQTTYRNGNSTSDRTCSCNTDQGYTFVVNSIDQCFCNPSTEDCSCYIGINPKNKTTGLKDPKCNDEPHFPPKLSRGDLLNQYQALQIDDFDNYKYNISPASNANRNTAAVNVLMIFLLYLVAIGIYIRRLKDVRNQFNVRSQEYGKLINEQKLEKRYFVKIMIVGREHAGKTSLMRRLLKKRFNENEQSTDGVDIVTRRCKINIKNGQWEIGKDVIDDKLDRMRRAQNRITDMSSDATVPTTKNGRKDININNSIVMGTEHLNNDNLDTITEDESEMIQQQSLVHHEHTGSSHSSVDKNEYQDESADSLKQIIKNEEGPYLHNLEGEASDILDDLISTIDFEKPSGDYALCGLWDFAGQKEFYATHQVFLTSCAVYLLVVDIDDDVKQSTNQYFSDLKDVGEHVDFWFDSIHCLCNDDTHAQTSEDYHIDPPVIIVCTGIDKYTTQIDERKELFLSRLNDVMGTKSKFHHYRDTFFVSNKEDVDDVFQKIRLEISETAKDLSNWAEKKPLQWILLEHLLEKIKSKGTVIVTYEQIYSLSSRKEFGIRNKPELNEFLAFQHNIGNIIFFENIDEYVILNPQWLADAFRCLVSDKIESKIINHPDFKVLRETGTLSPRLISDFFLSKPRSQFLKYKDHILKVMEKFDIIVRPKEVNFSEKEGCYILPYIMQGSTLKKVCELFKIDINNCTRTSWLCIEFDFLPPWFFYHVLAWYIRKYELNKLFRGIGVFDLEGSGCQQLIITTSENTLAIQVLNRGHGTEVTTDCIKIREEFYSKIRNFKQRRMRLRYDRKITCSNGDICKSSIRVERLQQNEFYRCPEHNTHSSHDVLSPWFKKVSQDMKIPTDKGTLNMLLYERNARNTNGGRTQKHLEDDTVALIQEDLRECTFVTTKAMSDGLMMLKQNGVLLITGSTGAGKSRLGRHLLHNFVLDDTSYKCIKLGSLTEFESLLVRKHRVVILLDDIFGETNCIYSREKDIPILDKVYAYVRNGIVKVIFTIRDTVKRHCLEVFDSHRLFNFHFIDLNSEEYALSLPEKENILAKYMKTVRRSNYTKTYGFVDYESRTILENAEVSKIIPANPVKGFPLAVYQFVHSDKYFHLGSKFFDRPTEAILEEINAIRRKGEYHRNFMIQYSVMVHTAINENCINLDDSSNVITIACIIDSIYEKTMELKKSHIADAVFELKGSYFKNGPKHNSYRFHHITLQESVILSFAQIDDESMIKIIPLLSRSFFQKMVKPESYIKKEGEVVLRIQANIYEKHRKIMNT